MKLKEHQSRVVDSDTSKIVYHSLGSGKTLTGLAAIQRAMKDGGKAMFIAPASLVNNVNKEIDKHDLDIDRDKLTIMSYEKAARNIDTLEGIENTAVVLDEAHRIRNSSKRRTAINKILEGADRRLLLSGSPIYNDVSDIGPLVNSTAQEQVLPGNKADFHDRYIGERVVSPKLMDRILRGKKDSTEQYVMRGGELRKIFNEYIDKHDTPQNSEDFPEVREKIIPVEMSDKHEQAYHYAESTMPGELKDKVRSGSALSRKEMSSLQTFSTGPRMAALGSAYIDKDSDHSSKLDAAVANLKARMNRDHKAVVYSNFIEGGIDPYLKRLRDSGLGDKYGVFKGGMTNKERAQVIEDYNSGKKPILALSSAGAEGLDLKGTRQVQVLDPHFNNEKIRQVIGRSARFGSHTHLPKDDQNVDVERYISTFSPGVFGRDRGETIDQNLTRASEAKDALNAKVRSLMEKKAVFGAALS